MAPAIRVEQLSKRYRVGVSAAGAPYRTLGETISGWFRLPRRSTALAKTQEFWALEDINFEVPTGRVLGIIGRNGAGKSTLMKILAAITSPTSGFVELRGRVGSLLEVGTGFHPELSGRENIFLNGAILGMNRREIVSRFDEIVEFSGVERFLDTPVKRYSSGMRVRLAFAVAAHLEPEILLIDEVLAVGDLAFQKKCLARMGEIASDGRTVLLISHNVAAIQGLCDDALLLSGGQLVTQGPANEVVERYVRELNAATGAQQHADVSLAKHAGRPASCRPLVRRLRVLAGDGRLASAIPVGAEVTFELEYENEEAVAGLGFAIILCTDTGQRLAVLHSRIQSQLHVPGYCHGRLLCRLPELPLLPGAYRVDIEVRNWGQLVDSIEQATLFSVLENDYFGTGRLPDRKWGAVALGCQWSHRVLESPRTEMIGSDASASPALSE